MKMVARNENTGKLDPAAEKNAIILNSLSRKRIYARLDFIQTNSSDGINLEADYFDNTIHLIIAYNTQHKVDGLHQLVIRQNKGKVVFYEVFEQRNVKKLLSLIARSLNAYIKTRPFTIVKYDHGQYRLLDPNGMDYIGQYVTLKDAKKVSYNNYVI